MVKTNGVVIVGGAIAGYNVARQLRTEGYEGNITMMDAKNTLPYDRAELSKDWMAASDQIEPPLFQKQNFFDENKIDVKLNTLVTDLDPTQKIIRTKAGEEIPYQQLVLATGSSLRKLEVPGAETLGVFYLRDYRDALEIKEWAKKVKEVAIVGGGFIGLELAATFTELGLQVTVIEYSDYPLGRILGKEASKYFRKMHESHGVKFITGEGGKAFEQDAEGKLTKVITTEGTEIPAQLALVGVGVVPNVSVDHPDLEVAEGVVVDEYGETSIPDVYAAGDVAVWPYQGKMIHVEHWENAYNQGRYVAKNIIQPKSHPYRVRPYFWTDQYDQTFERLGYMESWDRTILRGSLESNKFTIAYVDEKNKPLAILFANKGDTRKEVSEFMNRHEGMDEERFKDTNQPLNVNE